MFPPAEFHQNWRNSGGGIYAGVMFYSTDPWPTCLVNMPACLCLLLALLLKWVSYQIMCPVESTSLRYLWLVQARMQKILSLLGQVMIWQERKFSTEISLPRDMKSVCKWATIFLSHSAFCLFCFLGIDM